MFGRLVTRKLNATAIRRMSAAAGSHGDSTKLWKNISLFVALPCVVVMSVNVGLHMKHEFECPPPRPEFIPYEHLRIRNKRFPWGDGQKSLFHNSHLNPLPDGYEEDEH
ncbi:unnamed protein product [Orchesella dallaii]|uniref:Cytochrome c oxidase subunit n=1 Tax=Orchesella dallaii TaxID=48710 RepID=A0ABP1QHK6_9HEXA